MQLGKVARGLVVVLLSLVGCGGPPQDTGSESAGEVHQSSCVSAWFECGVGGARYAYTWPDSCAAGGYTHSTAFQACEASCRQQCIDTGDLGSELSVSTGTAR
ncbi:hypothetical protein LZ198_03430 [Myxococcus sp. K15C18031901]|uniref:hypothetical protein n=1 Tax=Myxococcus dinghuensis TaxID=2906761 RepID=UPI0020A77DEC|nr:hypothetical protein [Myxococcus dinghuensis]MCP3097923.1 hypothetical protein [Myxococcus dinghuensis]